MKTYIIAEIGINHNGDIENCYKMINTAAAAGCDAVKFQLFRAKNLYPKSAGMLDWLDEHKAYSYDIYSSVEKSEMPEGWIDKLMVYCAEKKIDFLASVFDKEGCDFLSAHGFKTAKLASYVATNIPLIEYCAKRGLSIILSTGGATLGEVFEAVETVLKYHNKLALLHCSIQYPTQLKDCNLGVIETYRKAFPCIDIGYSDHTKEVSEAAVQAVYLGARIIEKHITLNKDMTGPDHFFALEPHELAKMVADIRKAEGDCEKKDFCIDEVIYGSSEKKIYSHEKHLRDFAFMRLYSGRDICPGDLISANDINILRSGKKEHGLEPKFIKFFDKYKITAKKNIKFEDPITWDCILG